MNKLIANLMTGLGAIGSAFIKKTTDGGYEVAIAPITLAMVIGSGAACAAQTDEPFRVCLKDTLATVKEVFYAN